MLFRNIKKTSKFLAGRANTCKMVAFFSLCSLQKEMQWKESLQKGGLKLNKSGEKWSRKPEVCSFTFKMMSKHVVRNMDFLKKGHLVRCNIHNMKKFSPCTVGRVFRTIFWFKKPMFLQGPNFPKTNPLCNDFEIRWFFA